MNYLMVKNSSGFVDLFWPRAGCRSYGKSPATGSLLMLPGNIRQAVFNRFCDGNIQVVPVIK